MNDNPKDNKGNRFIFVVLGCLLTGTVLGQFVENNLPPGFVLEWGGDGWNTEPNHLDGNIDDCINMYGNPDDHSGIRSASLGEIKAMYR